MGVFQLTLDLIKDFSERLVEIMMTSDYYFSVTIHTGTNGDLEQIKGAYRGQETKVEDMGILREFSSVLEVNGKGLVGVSIL